MSRGRSSRLFPGVLSRRSGTRFEKKRLHGIIGDAELDELLQSVEDLEVGGDTGIAVDVAFEIEREVGRSVVDEAGGAITVWVAG
jgi:hypothetical protein